MADEDEARPWRSRMVEPENPPTTLAEAESELEHLREVQAHREWVIDGLREHVANIEANLATALARIRKLEEHSANLEERKAGLAEHVENLEAKLAEREARLADVEAHVVNLERRTRGHRVRLAEEGIFPSSARPRIEALFRRGEKIRSERPDLQERFSADRARDFWYWLMWEGPAYDEEIAKNLFPMPDDKLRLRVVGEQNEAQAYTRSGLVDWWTMEGSLRRAGFAPEKGGRLLDFGVGCGRILQFFSLYSETCEIHGADVDDEAIRWCSDNLDFARFHTLPKRPICSFDDACFDAIYAFSVFSHLREDLHLAWIEELARIARPGAAVVLTVQGRHVADAILDGQWQGAFPPAEALEKHLDALEKTGFAFFPYAGIQFKDDQQERYVDSLGRKEYGSTFILEPYIRANWTRDFELVAFEESPDEWQDYAILRRR